MIFSSMVFVCAFLPLVLFFYYIAPKKIKNYVLLVFSFAFYAWGEPKAFFVMLFVILLNYFSAILIEKFFQKKSIRIFILIFSLALNFLALFYFKYFDFAIKILNKIFHLCLPQKNIALPIGISFYIFQSVSYTIDVFRKKVFAQKNVFHLALYVSFFSQLVAGPIVKYHEINSQLVMRKITTSDFAAGVRRFVLGLCKKVLIANTMASCVDEIFSSSNLVFGTRGALAAAVASYALQIFYDFAGYSDMAIGLGRMFGFRFLENFNYPYISQSISEFWRRWHISLGTWFREYLYIPLGGNRFSKARNLFNIFVVFLATGVWHGAALNFVAWGLWHGAFNIFEKITGFYKSIFLNEIFFKQKTKAGEKIFFEKKCRIFFHNILRVFERIFKTAYTLAVVLIGWIFFRAQSLKEGMKIFLKIVGVRDDQGIFGVAHFFNSYAVFFFAAGVIFCFPIAPFAKNKIAAFCKNRPQLKLILCVVRDFALLALFLYALSCLASGTYNPFIYFRF